jgi:hypothetical protein
LQDNLRRCGSHELTFQPQAEARGPEVNIAVND